MCWIFCKVKFFAVCTQVYTAAVSSLALKDIKYYSSETSQKISFGRGRAEKEVIFLSFPQNKCSEGSSFVIFIPNVLVSAVKMSFLGLKWKKKEKFGQIYTSNYELFNKKSCLRPQRESM